MQLHDRPGSAGVLQGLSVWDGRALADPKDEPVPAHRASQSKHAGQEHLPVKPLAQSRMTNQQTLVADLHSHTGCKELVDSKMATICVCLA